MGEGGDWRFWVRYLVQGPLALRPTPVPEQLEGGWVARDCPVCNGIRKFRLEEEESRGCVDVRCAGCGIRVPSSLEEYPTRLTSGTVALEELIERTYKPAARDRMHELDAIAADCFRRQAVGSRRFLVVWSAMVCIFGAAIGTARKPHEGPYLPWFAAWSAVLIVPMVMLAIARRALVRRMVVEWTARALAGERLELEDLVSTLDGYPALRRLDADRVYDRTVALLARSGESTGTGGASV